ncbi:hypothetical protein ACFP3U_26610 [Kitasatospora misakiensis]|uniref:Septum formation-related domain-containing protein n=1 Tax=Kitasatospora misakiensis TaxID=67330 RepID=A0ABW0X9L8_9ACTN
MTNSASGSASVTPSARPSASASATTPSLPPPSAELTDAYFAVGQCAGPIIGKSQGGSGPPYQPVDCGDTFAAAKVTKRSATTLSTGAPAVGAPPAEAVSDCEDTTDLYLDLERNLLQATGATSVRGGLTAYACLRNLKAPHPGDPGMGGGPRIIVGDCVYRAKVPVGKPITRETACDATGAKAPEYRVAKLFVPNIAKNGPHESCPETAPEQLSLATTGKIDLFAQVACGEKL